MANQQVLVYWAFRVDKLNNGCPNSNSILVEKVIPW